MASISERILRSDQTAQEWASQLECSHAEIESVNRRTAFSAGILKLFLEHLGAVGTRVQTQGSEVRAQCAWLVDPQKQQGRTDWDIENLHRDEDYRLRWCSAEIIIDPERQALVIDIETPKGSPYREEQARDRLQGRMDALSCFVNHAFAPRPGQAEGWIDPLQGDGESGGEETLLH